MNPVAPVTSARIRRLLPGPAGAQPPPPRFASARSASPGSATRGRWPSSRPCAGARRSRGSWRRPATRASTSRSRAVRPKGSSGFGPRGGRRCLRPLAELQPRPRGQRLHLLRQPRAAEPARGGQCGRCRARSALAVAARHERLGLAPARVRGDVGAVHVAPSTRRPWPRARRHRHRWRARTRPRRSRAGRPPPPRPASAASRERSSRASARDPRGGLGLLVATVAGRLAGVTLHTQAHHGQRRHPHHVLGAVLDPVERVVDHGARGVDVPAAARQLPAQDRRASPRTAARSARPWPPPASRRPPPQLEVAAPERELCLGRSASTGACRRCAAGSRAG